MMRLPCRLGCLPVARSSSLASRRGQALLALPCAVVCHGVVLGVPPRLCCESPSFLLTSLDELHPHALFSPPLATRGIATLRRCDATSRAHTHQPRPLAKGSSVARTPACHPRGLRAVACCFVSFTRDSGSLDRCLSASYVTNVSHLADRSQILPKRAAKNAQPHPRLRHRTPQDAGPFFRRNFISRKFLPSAVRSDEWPATPSAEVQPQGEFGGKFQFEPNS